MMPSRSLRALSLAALLLALSGAGAARAQTPPPAEEETQDPAPVASPESPAEPETDAEAARKAEEEAAALRALEGSTIGEIRILPQSIFNPDKPGEDKLLFRLADRLHRTTRPHVIESQLLLRPGDSFSVDALQESERLLRANRYLYDADIRPIPAGDGRVDLEVVTRDVWTLQGGVSFKRAGGENAHSIHLEDYNFLGTGKEVTLLRVSDVDRTSNLIRYRDPGLIGSRTRLELSYADNSDGGRKRFELERPFFSMDARWAAGLRTMLDERIEPLYDTGRVVNRFAHERDFAEVYAGLSPGRSAGGTHRWKLGFTYDRERFGPDGGLDSTSVVPEDRELSYPWIGYEYVQDGFIVERGLDRLRRTEDLNLGKQIYWRLGWSTPSLGADVDRLIFETGTTAGWRSARQLLLASAQGSTRWRDDDTENLRFGAGIRYYVRNFRENVFYASLEGEIAENLDLENQILLGGDTGLRGYPLRLQSGDRRYLLTLEQRFFSDREYFHLVNLGAAIFFDAGRAWMEDPPRRQAHLKDQKLLKDVGIGLRIGSSRSSKAAMVHLDLAFPLDGDDTIEGMQWLVSTSETF